MGRRKKDIFFLQIDTMKELSEKKLYSPKIIHLQAHIKIHTSAGMLVLTDRCFKTEMDISFFSFSSHCLIICLLIKNNFCLLFSHETISTNSPRMVSKAWYRMNAESCHFLFLASPSHSILFVQSPVLALVSTSLSIKAFSLNSF